MYRQVRQYTAIQGDVSLLQAVDETTVRKLMQPGCRVDPCNPQSAELTLTLTAVTLRILSSAYDRLFRNLEGATAGAVVTARLL